MHPYDMRAEALERHTPPILEAGSRTRVTRMSSSRKFAVNFASLPAGRRGSYEARRSRGSHRNRVPDKRQRQYSHQLFVSPCKEAVPSPRAPTVLAGCSTGLTGTYGQSRLIRASLLVQGEIIRYSFFIDAEARFGLSVQLTQLLSPSQELGCRVLGAEDRRRDRHR